MHRELPTGLEPVRTTPVFDRDTVPKGLLAAHRIASGVWGKLVVHSGSLLFRFEDHPGDSRLVPSGEYVVIPPDRPHRVELDDGPVSFSIEFHRPRQNDADEDG